MRRLGICCALAAAVLALAAPAAPAGEWLAGDLHVHTCFSHDVWCPPDDDNTDSSDFYTLGFNVAQRFALAHDRGLDYLAITDHNDVRSQSAPGFGAGGVIAVPGYENSLKGHAQMLGARHLYDAGDKSPGAIAAMADRLRADGGVFQANHPIEPRWAYQYEVPVESSEVWNLAWFYQPPFPSAEDNDSSLRYWQGWQDRGRRVAATGGSDSHWQSTSAVQGVGQPTTWIYASDRSAAGILAGLRAGHTFVSHQPPLYGGPRVFIEGDRDGDGRFEAIAGDTVPPGSKLRVRVEGAPGATLRVVTDHGATAFAPVPVEGARFEHRFTLPAATTWAYPQVYGEDVMDARKALCEQGLGAGTTYCRNRILMLALSSALYLRPDAVPPPTPFSDAGVASLRAPSRCVRRSFVAAVVGRRIASIVLSVDGRRVAATRRGSLRRRVGVRRLRPGRHVLRARVRFVRRSSPAGRTLARSFRVCGAAHARRG